MSWAAQESEAVLEVRGLSVVFNSDRGRVHAVRDLSFSIASGEIMALVGESGSGKSTAALAVTRLLPASASISGSVTFDGLDLLRIATEDMRQVRGHRIGIIFQDPFTGLNPVRKVGWQIGEVLRTHSTLGRAAVKNRVLDLLDLVGIPQPGVRAEQYPHQFSGGMRQRVMIAMAVACNPSLLIADEPTTALDVTIQERIVELLAELRSRLNMSVLLITHNLGLVARIADSVVVAYAGRVAEAASADSLFQTPLHPYTKGLMKAVPQLHSGSAHGLAAIPGSPPDPYAEFAGCAFAERCPDVLDRCTRTVPELRPHLCCHATACFAVERQLQEDPE